MTTKPKRKLPRSSTPQPIPQHLKAFKRLLGQTHFKQALQNAQLSFYDRIFTPTITLWCMIFQRLNPDHTLHGAVTHLHSGGADQLAGNKAKPPSKKIKSRATTAFSNARERLPLNLLSGLIQAHVKDVWNDLGHEGKWRGLRVLLLDGSQLSIRPHPKVTRKLPTSSNNNGKYYWVLMRVVAAFCAHTGMVVSSAAGSNNTSEQALATRQISRNTAGSLYLGDRNFGVRQMVQAIREAGSDCLFRMMKCRAAILIHASINRPGDYPINWTPSRTDRKHEDCSSDPIAGRLIVARYSRPGFRTQWIYLFTTLTDSDLYPASALIELYGIRWQVELNLRYLKTQMDLDHLEVQSADMAEKEWLAGLMAYNLVRLTMSAATPKQSIMYNTISFSDSRRLLLSWLLKTDLCRPVELSFQTLVDAISKAKLPSRKKKRPPEPRAARHKREPFPPLRGDRATARRILKEMNLKS
jgi:hypothetical protein